MIQSAVTPTLTTRLTSAWQAFRQPISPARTMPTAPDRTKMVGPKGAKVAVSARRPSFQAANSLPMIERLKAMGPRGSSRSRNLLDMLLQIRDYNPDASKAVENIVTLCNPGYDLNVYAANRQGDDGKPVVDVEGKRLIQQFATRMFSEYSGAWDELSGAATESYPGLDAFISMSHLVAFTQGAMAAEVELTETLDDIVDVYPVDPALVDFRMDTATNRLVPGLMIQGPFTPLDPVRFRYVPKDPDVGQPAGRSPLLAALDTVFFLQQFMRELQAIAHMVNTPRLDIKVVEELVNKSLTETRPDLLDDSNMDARRAYVDAYLTDIQNVINTLEVDDAFVHFDAVEATFIGPGGTAVPVRDIMAAIDKMIVSGLKQLPLLLGRNEGATTTHATVQWQVFIKQLESYQRISKALVTWALNLYLRIQGRQSYVTFEYKPHKTSDTLLDAQAENIAINSWKLMVDNGWATNDEAAQALLQHPAVGAPVAAAPPVAPEGPPRSEPVATKPVTGAPRREPMKESAALGQAGKDLARMVERKNGHEREIRTGPLVPIGASP